MKVFCPEFSVVMLFQINFCVGDVNCLTEKEEERKRRKKKEGRKERKKEVRKKRKKAGFHVSLSSGKRVLPIQTQA